MGNPFSADGSTNNATFPLTSMSLDYILYYSLSTLYGRFVSVLVWVVHIAMLIDRIRTEPDRIGFRLEVVRTSQPAARNAAALNTHTSKHSSTYRHARASEHVCIYDDDDDNDDNFSYSFVCVCIMRPHNNRMSHHNIFRCHHRHRHDREYISELFVSQARVYFHLLITPVDIRYIILSVGTLYNISRSNFV